MAALVKGTRRWLSTGAKTFFGAIDQGTSSTRFIVFDELLNVKASHQVKIEHNYPHPGWAEMKPEDIIASINTCAEVALEKAGLTSTDLKAVGVTNQRETSILWDKNTGEALSPAMLWFDNRTKALCQQIMEEVGGGREVFSKQSGLMVSPYFSAFKLRWFLENDEKVQKAVEAKAAAFGTVESFIIWNLTEGKYHVTDCTNASRTMLMDINTLEWSEELSKKLLGDSSIISELLPSRIVSNAEPTAFGSVTCDGPLKGAQICGSIGDQQSALVGQRCFEKGQMKNTFGTGQFLLLNTGTDVVYSQNGLLSTVAYKMGENMPTTYALEGSVAISGVGIKWLIESLELGESPEDIMSLASSVETTKGLYFVPAFNGLLAPHWNDDARGIMIGWTNYHTKAHLCRALVEALCFQCRDVIEAMEVQPNLIKVDGGVAQSDFAMQVLANLTAKEVERPANVETTALGAAITAGLGSGHWKNVEELQGDELLEAGHAFSPLESAESSYRYSRWGEAIKRCSDWETHHDGRYD